MGTFCHVLFTMVRNSHHDKRWEHTLWIQVSSHEVFFTTKLTLTKETSEIIEALKDLLKLCAKGVNYQWPNP